jgi:transcriptional regulator with XRE-family HTH domain
MRQNAIRPSRRTEDARKQAGRNLRAAREALGLTQERLASELGMTPHALSQWESGARRINTFGAVILKRRYGITLDWLFAGDLSGLPHDLALSIQKHGIRQVK